LFEEVDEIFIKRVRNYFDKEAKNKKVIPPSLIQNTLISIIKVALRSAFEGYSFIN
jgi:hypothetical protein